MIYGMKIDLLCYEAKRWVGFTEVGGDNRGQIVEAFQMAVGSSPGEAWCVSFIQYCIKNVDAMSQACGLYAPPAQIAKTASVLQLWNKTPIGMRDKPARGNIILWEHYKDGRPTGLGHAGIVCEVKGENLVTVEGNTSPGIGINREGDGVYLKNRIVGNLGNMHLLGFLRIWN